MTDRPVSNRSGEPQGGTYERLLDKDLLKYFPVKLFPAVSGLASIIILTRVLLPEQYGIYSIVMTTGMLVVQLTGSWLPNAILFVYPDYRLSHAGEFERKTMRIQALTCLPAAVIACIALLLFTHRPLLALFGTAILVVTMFQNAILGFLQSNREVSAQAVAVGIQSVVQLAVLSAGILLWDGKEGTALVSVLAGLCGSFLYLLAKRGNFWSAGGRTGIPTKLLFRRLFDYGMPMCIWYFAMQFSMFGDRILLTYFRSAADVGPYASFRDLSVGCAGFLTMPLLLASHPIIMAMWKEGQDKVEIENLMSRNIALLTLLFVPLLVMVDLCGPELVGILFGAKYLVNKYVMLLVMLSVFISAIIMYIQKGLEVTGKTRVIAKIALFISLLSLILNLFAIRWSGVVGAASVVVLSQFVYVFIVWQFASGILKVSLAYAFMAKIACWVVVVELLARSVDFVPVFSIAKSVLPYLRFSIVAVATIVLFSVSIEIRSIGALLRRPLVKGPGRVSV